MRRTTKSFSPVQSHSKFKQTKVKTKIINGSPAPVYKGLEAIECLLWILYLFTKDLFNEDSKLLSQMTQEEFKTLLEKTIRDTAKIKSGIANVAATKHFVTENVEDLKKEISKALKDNASDSMKIKLINNLVQKNDKCPILFTNGTFMSCLKAILELDKNK